MSKLLRIAIPLTLLAALSLACSLNPFGRTEATEVPATTEALVGEAADEPEEAVEAEQAGEPTAAPADDADDGDELSLGSLTSGLQGLDSYATHFEIVTLINGTPSPTGTLTMDIEFVREPLAERVVMTGGDAGEAIEMVQIGSQQFMTLGDGECMSMQAEGDDTLGTEEMQPDEMFSGLSGARRVRPDETINGVLCRHYTFDEKALMGISTYSRAEGEVWVAVDGGYVVKYILHAQGFTDESQKAETGTDGAPTDWTMFYELREVNSGLTIEPPEGCGAAGDEYPTMPDATNVTTMSGLLMYDTASSLADVTAFYLSEMPAQGWAESGETTITDEMAMLTYSKGDTTASIYITLSDGKVSVMISSE